LFSTTAFKTNEEKIGTKKNRGGQSSKKQSLVRGREKNRGWVCVGGEIDRLGGGGNAGREGVKDQRKREQKNAATGIRYFSASAKL